MATFTGSDDKGNFIDGTESNDVISGLAGIDELHGHGGNDALSGGRDLDLVHGEAGDDLLFTEGADTLDGGAGIDVAILADSGIVHENFVFDSINFNNVEGIQDVPDSDTTVTLDSFIFDHIDGDRFLVAMGDGKDELRVVNEPLASGNIPSVAIDPLGQFIVGGDVIVGLEGVETVVVLDKNNNVTDTFTGEDLRPDAGDSLGERAFVGPGSVAERAAEAQDSSVDPRVSDDMDLSPIDQVLANLQAAAPLEQPSSVTVEGVIEDLMFF